MSTSAPAAIAERLARRTLALIDVPSVSGQEAAVLDAVRRDLPARFATLDDEDSVLFGLLGPRRDDVPLVVLAGHVDTVPIADNVPGSSHDGEIVGRGAADMKGAVAVMLDLAGDLVEDRAALDVGLLFFGREELPFGQSALLPLFERCPAATAADLAIVMEPTANSLELGCMGNLNATVTVRGRAAHSARPWQGRNAIHLAIGALAPLAELPVRDVRVEGMTFREVVNVTTIEGGVAANVIPDRVHARVNMRYAPGHAPEEAEARLRELLAMAGVQVTIDGNAPAAPARGDAPLVQQLRRSGDLAVGPKQAWTPVAEFAAAGVDAVNFGPGDPRYAHRDDERVEVAALMRSREILRAFLSVE